MITWHNHKRHRKDKPRRRAITQFSGPRPILHSEYRKYMKWEKMLAQVKSDRRNLRQRMADECELPSDSESVPYSLEEKIVDLVDAMYDLNYELESAVRALRFLAPEPCPEPQVLPPGMRWSKRMEHYLQHDQ